ncbi:hypothetical protein GC098_36730 [Paenibacillus sp. LMG 31458]|uniref:FMN hydroxy acid dehydrogenase domain-containing protein n=2 Tax=Paenibacillus phytorum TaxID=2654977 RepID=A0ABX1Y7E8_9BACL|nr:hypothetical protein [Paenibacillus phytorum]
MFHYGLGNFVSDPIVRQKYGHTLSIADVVGARVPVMFDSGIRCWADIFKALALGAKMIFIGRPYLYGLTLAGETGVRHVIENIVADFDLNLGIADLVQHPQNYQPRAQA